MRKFIVVFFILATVLVFAACGEDIKPKTATYTIDGGMDTYVEPTDATCTTDDDIDYQGGETVEADPSEF